MCEQTDLVLYSLLDGEPVQRMEDGGNVLIFTDPHQDPGSAVLDVL